MRNRLIVLAAGLVFAASVASVALVAGRGDDNAALEKLPVGAAGGAGDAAASADRRAGAISSEATSLIAPVMVEYRLAGPLPDLAATAPAYRLTANVTAPDVARLARTLGLDGPVVEQPERLVVRDGDRELSVERQPGLPWYLGTNVVCADSPEGPGSAVSSDGAGSVKCAHAVPLPAPAPVPAPAGAEPAPAPRPAVAVATSPVLIAPEPGTRPVPAPCPLDTKAELLCGEPPPPVRPADLPSRSEAEALARSLFTELGVGLDAFEINDGFDSWYAAVQPRVGGLPVSWSTTVSIGPRGQLTWASGFLAVPEAMGDYPLAGAAAGFERLKSATFGGGWSGHGGGAEPVPLGAPEPDIATDLATDLATDDANLLAPVAPGPFVQTISGVSLALSFLGDRLVPVYRFEIIDGGGYVEAPAVVDELLEEHVIIDR